MSVLEAQKGMTDLIPCNEQCGGDMGEGRYRWTQSDQEVVIEWKVFPEEETKVVTGKMLSIEITPTALKMGLKGKDPVINGTLFKPVKQDDCIWTIEEKKTVVVTLFKSNLKYEEWWPHVCLNEPQVDMKTLKPPSKNFHDLDDGAQATVSKMMFDQDQQRKGMPTSEQLKMQEMMRNMPPPPAS